MTSAREFTNRLSDLLRQERFALADFLVALAEFDRRRLWVDLGHASLFYFLHRELGLSKGAAFYRKTAAELIQRFPKIVEPLRDGRLCLTSIVELSKVLTPENRDIVLPRFFQISKREAKEVCAEIRPNAAPPRRDVVTAARVADAVPVLLFTTDPGQAAVHPANQTATIERVSPAPPAPSDPPAPQQPASAPAPLPQRDAVEPVTAELSRLHVTVSRRFLRKLEAARAALSHSHPTAGMEEILAAGLDLLLDRHAKRMGLVKKPRSVPPAANPEHVPAHVKRGIWERDGGRCKWPLEGGGICGSTYQVELDHVQARGLGGPSTIENCRLLCKFHNDLAAREAYGDAWMDQFTRGPRAPRDGAAGPPPSR